ncbi:hypothetical protein Pyn_24375 [Prunus yedoensis var. nudiflora]|uniref:Non-haem dioxygenase N-terminal domain-containing protein n=1 Tax=Prunus yedoensis var. nudiflora TaxID=2094558 RepID=A0A314YBN9_PRUYE|nr:hypothetical protein Pyn_24375 [Prunus yedoensis var. nudiflora]
MAIPVIDFSKLDGEERAQTLAQLANGCEEWGFFQLVNHGISDELLERVKKVSSECFKLEREEEFKKSALVKSLNGQKLENVDWWRMSSPSWMIMNGPRKPPDSKYRTELKKLAERIMEVMDENLGLPKGYIKKAFNGGEEDVPSLAPR